MSIADDFLGNAMDLLGRYARGNGALIAAIKKAIYDLDAADLGIHTSGIIRNLRRALSENEGRLDA